MHPPAASHVVGEGAEEFELQSDSEYEVGLEMTPEWIQQLAATQARRNRRWVACCACILTRGAPTTMGGACDVKSFG